MLELLRNKFLSLLWRVWDGTGPPMLVLLAAVGFGVAAQLFVWRNPRVLPPAVLACVSLVGVFLPLPLISLGARAGLLAEPLDLSRPEVELVISRSLATTALLIPLLLLSGVALAAVLRARHFGLIESFGPIAAGVSLASLSGGLAWTAASEAEIFPRGTFCAPIGLWEHLSIWNGELAALRQTVQLAFISLFVIAVGVGAIGWLRTARRDTTSSLLPSLVMLGASALLVAEALPFYSENVSERLPFEANSVISKFAYSVVRTPDVAAPEPLSLDITVLLRSSGVSLGEATIEVRELAEKIHEMKRAFNDLHNAANDFGPREIRPIIIAKHDATRHEFQAAIEELADEAHVVQLGFLSSTVLERPLLGRIRTMRESGVTLSLVPEPGTTGVEFRNDETYESFARRAVEARRHGKIHHVLP